jgi:hypothetical protein
MVSDQVLRKWKLVQSLSRRPLKPLKGPLPRRCHILGEHPELSHFEDLWQYQCPGMILALVNKAKPDPRGTTKSNKGHKEKAETGPTLRLLDD